MVYAHRCLSACSTSASLYIINIPALKPAGGRALVTVWAYEQEEQKLLSKWQRIQQLAGSAAAAGVRSSDSGGSDSVSANLTNGQPEGGAPGSPAHRISSTSNHGNGCSGSSADDSLDYMVPWHLPFHRLEAAAVAARTVAAAGSPADSARHVDAATAGRVASDAASCVRSDGGSVSGGDAAGKPFARIDAVKKTIVFERYYHLFRQGELEELAAEVPGASVVDAFFDKSNWCIVLQRDAAGCAGASAGIATPPSSIH
jgi:alkylated DNA repair protein alkB homolog 8